jgi:hypothetical protein
MGRKETEVRHTADDVASTHVQIKIVRAVVYGIKREWRVDKHVHTGRIQAIDRFSDITPKL